MTETKNNSQANAKTSTVPTIPDLQEGIDINSAIAPESGLDTFRSEATKLDNNHSANNLVARMLWGHQENASLNVRVSDDGALDWNNDVR